MLKCDLLHPRLVTALAAVLLELVHLTKLVLLGSLKWLIQCVRYEGYMCDALGLFRLLLVL